MTFPHLWYFCSSPARITIKKMDYSYPILRRVFNYYYHKQLDISDLKIFSCQHLLAPQYEMYKLFIKFGFDPKNIIVLGKAYSSNKGIILDLQSLGIKVVQQEFSGTAFDKEHAMNCRKVVEEMFDTDKNIILDDGGYLIYEAKKKNVLFAVEQTSSGFRKLENEILNFPVFNVARSKTKLIEESPIIGNLICERLKSYFAYKNILSPKIFIIGLGHIGNSLLNILEKEGFNVTGFDVEKDKDGIISHLRFEKPDVVIGATGSSLFDSVDLNQLVGNHVYHFISVSSSDREFPVAGFRKNSQVHDDICDRNFVFVNNGFPITFKGNRYESSPAEIEKTIALLMGSIMHGVIKKNERLKGIIEIPDILEDLINS